PHWHWMSLTGGSAPVRGWRMRMDPVSLVVGALAAGAAAGVKESASAAVHSAYDGLRDLLRRRWAKDPAAVTVLDQHAEQPAVFEQPLRHYLEQTNAASDPDVVALAGRLMELADPAEAGKYTIDLRNAQAVQVGDHNVQTNEFRTGQAGR